MGLLEELQQSVEAYNAFLAEVWAARQGELRLRLDALARELAASEKRLQSIEEVRLEAVAPPAVTVEQGDGTASRQRVRISCPGDGHWKFFSRLRATVPVLGTKTFEVEVGKLKVTATLNLERGSRTFAKLLPASGPRVFLDDFDPDSSNFFADTLLLAARPILRKIVKRLIRGAIADALPSSSAVDRIEQLQLAPGAVVEIGVTPPMIRLKTRALEISKLVQQEHLPDRSLLSARLSGPDFGDPLDTYTHFHDSAIWTGHYVAAEAFRCAASTGSQAKEAADNALVGLRGLEAMINISGRKGLLSRVLVRSDSRHRETMAAELHHPLFTGSFRGVEYASQAHITRDQFAGAYLGAGMALRHVSRTDVQTLASRIVRDMTRYLIDVAWCPEEPTAHPVTGIRHTSVTYLASPSHVLAILQVARQVDDAFEELYQRQRALTQMSWLVHWLQTLDPHSSYYKFNLEHGMALLLLGLEDDPAERERLADGFRTMRRAIRFHANAYFNLVELTVFEDQPELLSRDRELLVEESRQLLTDWLDRPAIMEALDLSGDDTIDLVLFPGLSESKQPETISRRPLPVAERPGTDFLWQRSPFGLLSLDIHPLRAIRPPGVDLLLPYWMGRRLGIFTAN